MLGITLIKLLPFRDWLYAGIAIAGVIFWFHHDAVEKAKGAAQVRVAVAAASQKVEKAAIAQVAALNAQHNREVAQVSTTYENALVVASSEHAADIQRLRNYRNSGSHPGAVLEGATGASAQAGAGTQGASRLGTTAAELADALRQDDAALAACYAERDSLTGK